MKENPVVTYELLLPSHSVWRLLVMLQIQHLPYSLNNFMNPMLCQAARSIPTSGWEIYEQGLYDIAQIYQGKLWQYRVDPDRKWNGG